MNMRMDYYVLYKLELHPHLNQIHTNNDAFAGLEL